MSFLSIFAVNGYEYNVMEKSFSKKKNIIMEDRYTKS